MDRKDQHHPATPEKKTSQTSPVRAVISWLVQTDREFRVAQSKVNDTYFRR